MGCHRAPAGDSVQSKVSQLTKFPVMELELAGLVWAVLKDLEGEARATSAEWFVLLGVVAGGLRMTAAAE